MFLKYQLLEIIEKCAKEVSLEIGPYHDERANETVLCDKLEKAGIKIERQRTIDRYLGELKFTSVKMDIWLPDYKVILELKALVGDITVNIKNQVLHYLGVDSTADYGIVVIFHRKTGEYEPVVNGVSQLKKEHCVAPKFHTITRN